MGAASPSTVLSRETYERSVVAAPLGASPRHSSSISPSAETGRPGWRSSSASNARWRRPPRDRRPPSFATSIGPSTRKSSASALSSPTRAHSERPSRTVWPGRALGASGLVRLAVAHVHREDARVLVFWLLGSYPLL